MKDLTNVLIQQTRWKDSTFYDSVSSFELYSLTGVYYITSMEVHSFILFILIYVFVFVFPSAGPSLVHGLFCSCREEGLIPSYRVQASHCFSCCVAWILGCTGIGLWCLGLVAPRGTSQTSDWTCVTCLGRRSLSQLSHRGSTIHSFILECTEASFFYFLLFRHDFRFTLYHGSWW